MSFTRSRIFFMLISIYQLVQIVSIIFLWSSSIPLFIKSHTNGKREFGYPFSMTVIDKRGVYSDEDYRWYILLITWTLPWIGNCMSLGALIGVGIGIILEWILNLRNRRHKDVPRDQTIFVGFVLTVEVYKILGFGVFITYVCLSTPFCFRAITKPLYSLLTLTLAGVVFFLAAFYKMLNEANGSNKVKEPRIYTNPGKKKRFSEAQETQTRPCKIFRCYQFISCFQNKIDNSPPCIGDTEKAIASLIRGLWKRDFVGIGRDAKGLSHSSLKVESIRLCKNKDLLEKYMIQKVLLSRYSDSCSPIESYYDTSAPIYTNIMLQNNHKYHVLSKNIDNSVNEAYLFHGTDSANVDSILMNGFDVTKCSRPFCGRGVYFAESPVKSDQYTGPPGQDSYVMILSRVLLGNMVVITDPKLMVAKDRPFCSECLSTDCSDVNHRFRHQFDSVVLDRKHGLFREFVIFDDCLAYPEFVITYKRLYGYKCVTN